MFSDRNMRLGKNRSVIREIFEYGKKRGAQIGAENLLDFSLGNPSVPAPACVNEAIRTLMETKNSIDLHGYTSAQGDASVRKAIAAYLAKTHSAQVGADDLYMTAGAAASLTICLHAITVPGDEVIIFTPFFPEYVVFVEGAGGKAVVVPSDPKDFQIDFDALEKSLTKNTKAVVVNSPNNPSGVVLTRPTIERLCSLLKEKSKEYGHPIFLISDEPYRELVYGDIEVPFLPNHYDDTFVCYSFSKSLSLPGERIGYILVSPRMQGAADAYAAVCGAGRTLGYVCAPSMFQQVVAMCLGHTGDLSIYQKNRDLIYGALTEYGYRCIHPDGAFYLFLEALESDAAAFCERAKKYELLLVPADSFGCPGFVRISYCVSTEMIKRSLPAFKKLAEEYR